MVTRPAVAVVVATAGRPTLLGHCLDSLVAATTDDDDVVLSVPSAEDAARCPTGGTRVRVVDAGRAGKSHQLNAAVRTTSAALVLLTDDDCRVPAGWVEAMTAPFADDAVGLVFGPVRGLTRVPGSEPVDGPPPGDAPELTWTFAHGAAMAVRRTAFEGVSGFDERLGPGAPAHGEEHDLVLRLRDLGWRVVVADAPPVEHLEWRTAEEELANALVYERGSGAFLGAALRRDLRRGLYLLKHRTGYQRALFDATPSRPRHFARDALIAFVGGLGYGLRLRPRERG